MIFHDKKEEPDYFKDKAILITGGSRGIGFWAASAFLREHARVAICATSKEGLERSKRELGLEANLYTVPADVRRFKQVKDFVESAIKRFGRIDVLINNAGVAWAGDFVNQSLESINEEIDVNLKGVLFTTKAVLPKMIEQREGVIINVSSGTGKSGAGGLAVYSATKFGVVGFTEGLAQEVKGLGIRVYAICPGAVATEMQEQTSGFIRGLPPGTVAENILELAGPHPPVDPGECLEVYW
jgi:3-oxoacyl-[acyl-carrier protein] reductase